MAPNGFAVTREELYKQVWETPMRTLAQQYGLSDNGLAKICRRLNIPYPGRGFWRKRETGKKVKIKALPSNNGKYPNSVHITPSPKPDPIDLDKLRMRDEEANAVLQSISTNAREISIAVPKQISSWHPAIVKLFDHHKRYYSSQYEPTGIQKRQYRILHALFRELEKRGGRGCWGEVWFEHRGVRSRRDVGFYLTIHDERLDFILEETERYVKTPITEANRGWLGPGRKWLHEYLPTGLLRFKIKTYLHYGFPNCWEETSETPLEESLPEIVATIVASNSYLADRRKEREREERRRTILAQKKYRSERRQKIRENQWKQFLEISNQYDVVQKARALLNKLTSENFNASMRIGKKDTGEWLTWLETRIHDEEDKFECESILQTLSEAKPY